MYRMRQWSVRRAHCGLKVLYRLWEVIQLVRQTEGVQGVHIFAYRQERPVAEIAQETGILEGRTPWYPGRYDPAVDNRLSAAKA